MYPVMLNLSERPALVVGGGEVALRKAEGLLEAGARVTVLAPVCLPALRELIQRRRIALRERAFHSGDTHGFGIVFATTDDRAVNAQVFEEAKAAGIWVNVADDPELCTFHLPARVKRGAFQLAIASAGGAPFVVRRLRQLFERKLGEEWAEWLDAATRFRRAVHDLHLPRAAAEERYDAFFAGTVDADRLRARVPGAQELSAWLAPEVATPEALRPHPMPHAHSAASIGPISPIRPIGLIDATEREDSARGNASVPAPGHNGFDAVARARLPLVSLVGAGPGDPGLLTVRARTRLREADAIVYDRLAIGALPCDLKRDVELHGVGKEAGHHSVPQEETNALLVRLGREGRRTVRLKGGDPLVFGRGSEEAEALTQAGIPYEIVPGVTSGIGALASAGIPPTHRGESVRLTLVTAHESSKSDGPQVRWDLLAQDPHATLVGYMGVSSLPAVVAKLVEAGMPADTPAALVARGTSSRQRVVVSTLTALEKAGTAAGIQPPALFVIGSTVRHAAALDWFSRRPLFGQRLGLFTPAGALGAALDRAGAEVLEAQRPLSETARVVIGSAPLSGWLLRDAAEVDAVEEDRCCSGWTSHVRAVGLSPAAAQRARQRGWQHVVEVARPVTVENVIAALSGSGAAAGGPAAGPRIIELPISVIGAAHQEVSPCP